MIKFWNFMRNSEDDSAELVLYGELCSDEPWYTDDYVAYRQFIQELKSVTESTIHLRINSPGGEVMAANAIFNQLKECGKKITAHIDGMCASAATIPLMAADHIIASCNAMIKIHDPLICLSGYYNRSELDKITETCDKIKGSIIATYRSRIKDVSEEEFDQLMAEDRWMDANEAQEIGLVDEVAYSDIKNIEDRGTYLVVNSVKVKKEHVKNLPVNSRNGVYIEKMQSKKSEGGNKTMDDNETKSEIKSMEDLERAYPEFCKNIADRAAAAERQRMKDLDKIGAAVPAELLDEAKYGDQLMDARELALQTLIAEGKAGSNYLKDMKDDVKDSKAGEVPPSPEAGDAETQSEGKEVKGNEVSKDKVSGLANILNSDKRREQKK